MAYHTFEGRAHFFTAKAVLFQSYYWDGPIWFPLGHVTLIADGEETHVILVRDWLCKKNKIDEFTEYDEEAIEGFNDF